MTDNQRLGESLSRLFDSNRLVFWQDIDGEFIDALSHLELSDVEIVNVADYAPLEKKIEIELGRPDNKYLIYATGQRPPVDEDWFLDIRHYAASFSADRSSILLRDMGLQRPSLRDHIAARSKFFASQDRVDRLARLILPTDGEIEIDLKIMAVLLKSGQTEFFQLLMAVFEQVAAARDLAASPAVWDEFQKYGVDEVFWAECQRTFGYTEMEPSLRTLAIRLMATDFGRALNGSTPVGIKHLMLPNAGVANAIVLLDRWRDSALRHQSYDVISSEVAEALHLGDILQNVDVEVLKNAKTFLVGEKIIASQLARRITETKVVVDVAEVNELASIRQDGYWANPKWGNAPEAPRHTLSRVYDALVHAAELFAFRRDYPHGFAYPSAEKFWTAYETKLYRVDQLYRLFCEAADEVEREGWDIVKPLRASIEDIYCNGYVAKLALAWGKFAETMISTEWHVPGVDRQARFFNAHVQPHIDKGDERRSFVIISDAFRYEAAQELATQLNGTERLTAQLSSQLSVLPSYTALGMASLLPHMALTMAANANVLVDGKSSSGLENRNKILAQHAGVAIKAEDIMAMKKVDGRAFVEGKKVVYIYHNQIDQTADTGNEEETFRAVRNTINDITALVKHIVNSLNGNNIVITADHGFLFQETPPSQVERNAIDIKSDDATKSKKRYVIGKNLGESDRAWHGKMSTTSNVRDDTEFWVPKGANLFHFVGGARFVHGGAMLQEICVPIIKVSHKYGKAREDTKTRNVRLTLFGHDTKITSSRRRITVLQTEPVSDRVKAASVTVGIYANGEPISNVMTVTLDSTSPQMNEDWKKEVWLTLANRDFDKAGKYNLIVRNAVDGTEVVRNDVVIDLAFSNDF
ncbi:MAG: hypothetical protein JWR51_4588 [Devosia sp.]|uniref:BREX-1 system phosphatase PglZ type A n=1 Tax=Devosia sp. TaxID=1871048 RepID=UPI002613742E|nr:BREX-1 system phosphatase PglZ type A [Devosia sp.]MDB5531485.1 hypothetical protein [Devosia sp.]